MPTTSSRPRIRRVIALLTAIGVMATVVAIVAPTEEPAEAASNTAGFDAGMIISDGVFFDSSTMSAKQIQSFLRAKDPKCDTHKTGGVTYTCLADYTQNTKKRAAKDGCTAFAAKSKETAANFIYRVARSCHINPQVLLVTLQKEQGFINGGARSSGIYRKAMGYGCPDTAACNSKYYGFDNQVYLAAKQFQVYKANPSRWNFQAGKTTKVRYSPTASCGTKSVYIRNQATAGLYNYTPYTPNSAALKAGFGRGDKCSAYGNRNFFNYFNAWFGGPANKLKNPSFEANPGKKYWASSSKSVSILTSVKKSGDSPHSGKKFLRVTAKKAGLNIKQTLSYRTQVNGVYTGGVWLRAPAGKTVTGSLDMWLTGGNGTEKVTVPYEVTDKWTYVSTSITVAHSGHTQVRFIVYIDSKNLGLRVDDAEFFFAGTGTPPQPALTKNGVVNPGFETRFAGSPWGKGDDGYVTYAVGTTKSKAHAGSRYLVASTSKENGRIKTTVVHTSKKGETYTGGVWVRSNTDGTPVTGAVRLYAAGVGDPVTVGKAFTTTDTWTYVSVNLPIAESGQPELRLIIELDTPATKVRIDDASVKLAG